MQIILIMSTKLHFIRNRPAKWNSKFNYFNQLSRLERLVGNKVRHTLLLICSDSRSYARNIFQSAFAIMQIKCTVTVYQEIRPFIMHGLTMLVPINSL